MSITYAIMAVVSVILLGGYIAIVRKKEPWLLLLYICVTVVNAGYFMLSVSKTVGFAIFANDVAYLGSVFLSMSMLLTIVRMCGFRVGKKLVCALAAAGAVMFAVVATSGFLPWYYREVTLKFVDGATCLHKVYGPLHSLYLVYLLLYFAAMVACILQSMRKKMIASQKHAVLLAAIVLGNISVWLVEKFVPWQFEFLSISYLFSELILLGVHWMMQDYVRADKPLSEQAPRPAPVDIGSMPTEEKILRVLAFLAPGEVLALREREILELMLQNRKRKEIADELNLSENTIKTYTRKLYGKLGVSSREELYALLTK